MLIDNRIVVIHDDIKEESYLITKLKEIYEKVDLISDSEDGIEFIEKNHHPKSIIVLDIDFGKGSISGFEVLQKIRENSFLVEVIILSANEESDARSTLTHNINELPKLRPFDYIIRGSKHYEDKLLLSIKEASEKIQGSITNAINEWILVQARDKRDRPFIIAQGDKKYTLEDLKNAIDKKEEEGQLLEEKILMTAIKMLSKFTKES